MNKYRLLAALPWLPISLFVAAAAAADLPAVTPEVTPIKPHQFIQRGDVYFADFGQDFYGNLQVTFPGMVREGKLLVRLGEKLNPDGAIDRKPPGSVNYREIELVTHQGQKIYQLKIPTKPFHQHPESIKMPASIGEVTPFRYAEIEGSPSALDQDSLRQLAVHAPFNDSAAAFSSSDETLNAVWDLCKHTVKATSAFGIYIDGERERIPYEADAYIALLSHYACDLDPRVARVTFEYLLKHPTWPTEWSLQMPMVAEADYEATGNPVLAASHFEELKAKLLMKKARPDGLLVASAIVDWPASERDGYNNGGVDPAQKKQVGPLVNTVTNAFYYHALQCTARLARALQKEDEARDLQTKADQVYQAFNTVFYDSTRGIYLDGEGSSHASLHANMFPLAFGLVPEDHQSSVADFVQSRGMACSVYGAQFLLEGLYQAGRGNDAFALLTSHSDRSWWHMLQLGSTMTLEAWDAKVKPNLTWNHAWGAAPANIMARYVLGVRPLKPGYDEILIAPQPGPLKWMHGQVPTPHGPVEVAWESDARRFKIEVPSGTTARVILPGRASSAESISLNGKTVPAKMENGSLVIEKLTQGQYVILHPPLP